MSKNVENSWKLFHLLSIAFLQLDSYVQQKLLKIRETLFTF